MFALVTAFSSDAVQNLFEATSANVKCAQRHCKWISTSPWDGALTWLSSQPHLLVAGLHDLIFGALGACKSRHQTDHTHMPKSAWPTAPI